MSNDEWWDITDAQGAPTGETFRRGAPDWPTGRFHLIVAVCVHREDGSLLLTQRAAVKEFALGWEFPGGSALAGESSRAAASRELWEETGLAVSPEALTPIGRFVEASALLDFYTASEPSNAELKLQASEVAGSEWVTPSEVERRVGTGVMAMPWIARMDALWSRTLLAVRAAR